VNAKRLGVRQSSGAFNRGRAQDLKLLADFVFDVAAGNLILI
jgi:hypothetical protein